MVARENYNNTDRGLSGVSEFLDRFAVRPMLTARLRTKIAGR